MAFKLERHLSNTQLPHKHIIKHILIKKTIYPISMCSTKSILKPKNCDRGSGSRLLCTRSYLSDKSK